MTLLDCFRTSLPTLLAFFGVLVLSIAAALAAILADS
jgi:hypothetical protein